ncbi:MAG: phosphoenolpyruvate synthase [wastewater metagenome]|nr:phosphoenolpyruvate synthase [Candidatus Loosdrechtia aerotolerans]
MANTYKYIRWFESLSSQDVPLVGGKNASLGEMIRTLKSEGIRVPDGFATTAEAYQKFIDENHLQERMHSILDDFRNKKRTLEDTGESIRNLFYQGTFSEEIAREIQDAYEELSKRYQTDTVDVAVRSSATAEDLPEASFAGQQETYLNVVGKEALLKSCRKCYASLFTNRAISYRENLNYEHMKVALSAGIQKMVRADKASAGVIFSIDTETGFPNIVVINASWGLGENVVKGAVTPDEYKVFKPLLGNEKLRPIIEKVLGVKEKKMIYMEGGHTKNVDTTKEERVSFTLHDEEILKLARWACVIEKHYEKPMDMEWAKDGESGELFIVQARPETVQSRKVAAELKTYTLKESGKRLLSGIAIGDSIVTGKVSIIKSADEMEKFVEDSILATGMTDPDWVPIMRRSKGIITNYGGRTSHAAIVSRELGIPAVIGTGNATETLQDGQEITLSCAEGDHGYIYEGALEFEESEINLEEIPETKTQIMMNIASPEASFRWWRLPCKGIGLARMEFIINNIIKIHPMALAHFDRVEDKKAREQIEKLTERYEDKAEYFVDLLARGIAKIAAPQYPNEVIVRMSDFKTNEYANLIGGKQFEPKEDNPMLGFRGASRYYSPRYQEGFALECQAIKRVREEIGMANVVIMIPFCRTLAEADRVLEVLAKNGLKRHENGLKVYVMSEIPSNVILAEKFAERFDGFSIGSNDLTQLVLGVDRDSAELAELFDERNDAVKMMIQKQIELAHKTHTKVGICGQAPSDYPEFAEFLVRVGIDSMSLNPDSVVEVKQRVAHIEKQK